MTEGNETAEITEWAVERVLRLATEQILKARSLATTREEQLEQLNRPIEGDAEVRKLFWSLLYPPEQRQVFLQLHRNRHFWPRVKPLVGSPPFSFLTPAETQLLNASAIRSNRTKMAYEDENTTSSAAEIGDGHLVDASGRRLRIVDRGDRASGMRPFERLLKGTKLVCDLKIPRMPVKSRLTIAKARPAKHSTALGKVAFPGVNETVHFSPTTLVQSLRASSRSPTGTTEANGGSSSGSSAQSDSDYGVRLQVKALVQRAGNSPVCRLFAVVS